MKDADLIAWGHENLSAFWDAVDVIPLQDCKSTSGRRHVGDAYRAIMRASQEHRIAAGLTKEQAGIAIARATSAVKEYMVAAGWSGDTAGGWHQIGSAKRMTFGEAVREQRRNDKAAREQVTA